MYVCMYVCMNVYVYIYIYIFVCVYIYICTTHGCFNQVPAFMSAPGICTSGRKLRPSMAVLFQKGPYMAVSPNCEVLVMGVLI